MQVRKHIDCYGLLKMPKYFEKTFPTRPIFTGCECCTANVSKWLNGSLLPPANISHIRVTQDFLAKSTYI